MDRVFIETVGFIITSGAISIAIDQNTEMVDLATTGGQITKLGLGGSPWDVADEH